MEMKTATGKHTIWVGTNVLVSFNPRSSHCRHC